MRPVSDSCLTLGAAILPIAALVHFYWAAGGAAGMALAIPERDGKPLFKPSGGQTIAAGLLIGCVGLFYLALAFDKLPRSAPSTAVVLATIFVGLVFIARGIGDFRHVGVFDRGGNTRFAQADRLYYSPLCLYLGASGLAAATARFDMIG